MFQTMVLHRPDPVKAHLFSKDGLIHTLQKCFTLTLIGRISTLKLKNNGKLQKL